MPSFFSTTLLNSIAVGIKMMTSLLLNKVLALYVGPSGYALLGQFQNFLTLLGTVANGALSTAIIKYTAQYYDDDLLLTRIWRTAGTLTVFGSMLIALLLSAFAQPLATGLLHDQSFTSIFYYTALALLCMPANALLIAILTGKKAIRKYVSINIWGSVVALCATAILAWTSGIYGALVALSINQSLVFIFTIFVCYRENWFTLRHLFGILDPEALRLLLKYSLMSIISAACFPIAQMAIRNHISETFGSVSAGHWEALMRVSGLYLMVITVPLSAYYLPRISEIREIDTLRFEIRKGLMLIFPLATLGAFTIYYSRDWIITTLFTPDFLPMSKLFSWQMAGDVLKMLSWLLGYVLIGRAKTTTVIVTEIFFGALWFGLVRIATAEYGESGAQIAYFINYFSHFIVMYILVRTRVC